MKMDDALLSNASKNKEQILLSEIEVMVN